MEQEEFIQVIKQSQDFLLIFCIEINRIKATLIIERALERNYLKIREVTAGANLVQEIVETSDFDNR